MTYLNITYYIIIKKKSKFMDYEMFKYLNLALIINHNFDKLESYM